MLTSLPCPRDDLRQLTPSQVASCVSTGYTAIVMKDSGLRIRVQRDLRDKFTELCRAQDKPAAQVIREFMREYVETHQSVHPASTPGVSRHRRKTKELEK